MQFNIGDRVICKGTRSGDRVGEYATVRGTSHNDYEDLLITVIFDKDKKVLDLYAWRLTAGDGLSPVCHKIRQIENRFQAWQEKKSQQAAPEEKANAMV